MRPLASRRRDEPGLVSMQDVIVIAGGDAERRLHLANKLDSQHYAVRVWDSRTDLERTVGKQRIVAFLWLFPDQMRAVKDLCEHSLSTGFKHDPLRIYISASAEDNTRLRSLKYQGDEFLIEPVSMDEIMNIVSRSLGLQVRNYYPDFLTIGDLVLDRVSMIVPLRKVNLPLHPIQTRILEFLMLHPGRTFTRLQIATGVWTDGHCIDDRTVDVSIARIRSAWKHKVAVDPIRTVRGVGYSFNERFGEKVSLPKRRQIAKRAPPKASSLGDMPPAGNAIAGCLISRDLDRFYILPH
jgi:two-component system, OmpR family, phosphate regulon response regulator PhoB